RAAALVVVLAAGSARAEEPAALHRLTEREATLADQAQGKDRVARDQARAAYRLARKRQLGFLAEPDTRLEDARALDLALFAARRSAGEARSLREEVARVHQERQALGAAAARTTPPPAAAPPHFARPVGGA